MTMLQAIKLSKRFGHVIALDSLDLAIAPGEIFCLLGPNGAGKSTTLNLFLGLIRPSSGVARIDSVNVAEDPLAARRCTAYVPEQVRLYPYLTGVENIEYFLALASDRVPGRDELIHVLADAGLPADAARRPASTYSKGMQQKVVLGLALARQARLLLLDEPTSGLDPLAMRDLASLLSRLSARGAAILMVTHDLHIARDVGGRVGIMRQGRLVDVVSAADTKDVSIERLYQPGEADMARSVEAR